MLWLAAPALALAQTHTQPPVAYRVSFPEAEHHRMQVEVTFPDVPAGTLEVVMSRTSPGRYAIHEFAKNVYDVQIDDGAGGSLAVARPGPSQWNVSGHSGTVRVRYKVFGDRIDGTYLAIDATHAHLNIPASLMWARGLEPRPARVTFDAPDDWKIATQLRPTSDPRTFTAANLQYLIDSPTELSSFTLHTFQVDREFRIAVHHEGADADVERFAAGVQKIVREERAIFGEFPAYEVPYTFIADYLPGAADDGMEHRNSTVVTAPHGMRMPDEQLSLLSTIAHEFFHSWNVERIRPASLEPFRLDAPNPSSELWFAEGFTSYYAPLTMRRAGLWPVDEFAGRLGYLLDGVIRSPGRKYRSAEEMSRMAQFVDQAAWSDAASFPKPLRFVLRLGRRHRPWTRSLAARALQSPGHARRLHAAGMAGVRPGTAACRWRRRQALHDSESARPPRGGRHAIARLRTSSSTGSFTGARFPISPRLPRMRGSC